MEDEKALGLIRKLEYLKKKRVSWEQKWQYIAERFDPKNAYMTTDYTAGQYNPTPQSYDSTAKLAINKWAASIDSLTTPKNQKWHNLKLSNTIVNKRFELYLNDLRDVLFSNRYSSTSNFATANFDSLKTIGFYGNGPFSITIDKDKNLNYKAWAVKEFYVDQNFNGDIDTYFRVYKVSATQFRQQFKDTAPKEVLEDKSYESEYDILHAVYYNDVFDNTKLMPKYKRWASIYISLKHKSTIEESGFDTCPYIYQRYDVMPSLNDPYGYSPLMDCLPDIKTLNIMTRDNLRVGNRQGNPALLMTEDDIINAAQISPGMLIPEGLDSVGNPRIRALDLPGNIPFTYEFINGFKDRINQAFNLDLLQTIVNKRDMTATEVLQRSNEISTLLTPVTSRREREYLAAIISRELDLLYKLGKLPPMPEELGILLASKQISLQIEYESPIHKAQRAVEGQAIINILQTIPGIAAYDPRAKNSINGVRTINELGKVWGAPPNIFNTPEEREQLDAADAQAAQLQSMLQAGPIVADTSKTLSEI